MVRIRISIHSYIHTPLHRCSVCQEVGLAVTVTRSCVGVWDMLVGHLISQLADSPLGAIVTHALITPNGK